MSTIPDRVLGGAAETTGYPPGPPEPTTAIKTTDQRLYEANRPLDAKTHRVKSWTQFFWAIKAGLKLHDLRKNDRDYRVGDTVILCEYDWVKGVYTGNEVAAEISFITSSQFPCAFSSAVLPADYAILSLKVKL